MKGCHAAVASEESQLSVWLQRRLSGSLTSPITLHCTSHKAVSAPRSYVRRLDRETEPLLWVLFEIIAPEWRMAEWKHSVTHGFSGIFNQTSGVKHPRFQFFHVHLNLVFTCSSFEMFFYFSWFLQHVDVKKRIWCLVCVINAPVVIVLLQPRLPVDGEFRQIFSGGSPILLGGLWRPPRNMWLSHLGGERSRKRVNSLRGVSSRCSSLSSFHISTFPSRFSAGSWLQPRYPGHLLPSSRRFAAHTRANGSGT